MLHQQRNLVSNFVGCEEMHISIGPDLEISHLDTLLLSSDGLSDNLYDDEITACIRNDSLLEGAGILIGKCTPNMSEQKNDRICHPDDFTFITFRKNNLNETHS